MCCHYCCCGDWYWFDLMLPSTGAVSFLVTVGVRGDTWQWWQWRWSSRYRCVTIISRHHFMVIRIFVTSETSFWINNFGSHTRRSLKILISDHHLNHQCLLDCRINDGKIHYNPLQQHLLSHRPLNEHRCPSVIIQKSPTEQSLIVINGSTRSCCSSQQQK